MKYLYYKLKLNYKGTEIGITGLKYRVRYYSLVFPTTGRTLINDELTKDGLTEKFFVNSPKFIIFIEVKGGRTNFKSYVNLIKNQWGGIKVDTEAVKQGLLNNKEPYIIEVDLPLNPPFLSVSKHNSTSANKMKNETNYHQVESGENLSSIAKLYNTNTDKIIANNKLQNINIYPGMKLFVGKENLEKKNIEVVKSGDVVKHKVKQGETLTTIARKYNTLPARIALLNGISLNNLDYIKVGVELIITWSGKDSLIEKALEPKISNTLNLASYNKKYPVDKVVNSNEVKIYGLNIGANLVSIFGRGFDIGVAIDQYGDWMLFVAPGFSATFNPRDVNLHGKSGAEAWKEIQKNKNKLSKDIKITYKGIKQNVNVQFISDLKGVGFSKSHAVSVGPYNGAVSETWAEVDSERTIHGQQFEFGYEVGGKKIKDAVKDGKIVNYEESRGKSYTFSIISDESNANARKIFIADKAIEGN